MNKSAYKTRYQLRRSKLTIVKLVDPIIIYWNGLANLMIERESENEENIDDLIETFKTINIISQYSLIKDSMSRSIIKEEMETTICGLLLAEIEKYNRKIPIDYHPGSKDQIRNIIHPSVYPLIRECKESKDFDMWGRQYTCSKYQWLPSEVEVSKEGACRFVSYINNLPTTEMSMYAAIEKALEKVLPIFELQWGIINSTFLQPPLVHGYRREESELQKVASSISLRGRRIQIITKIVDINLKENTEGAYHVEGMSHENIVATASITIEQKDVLAYLYFKRALYEEEIEYLRMNTNQGTPVEYENLIKKTLVPLGKMELKKGTIISFPNSHVHRLSMQNMYLHPGRRVVLVFWLINPNEKITSTEEIPQQNYSISLAYDHRLELMKERTKAKHQYNTNLNLCEH